MMLITIIISSNVNPEPRPALSLLANLPILIFRAVQRRTHRLRINVKHVLLAPRVGIWIILHRAQPPLGVAGHRIDWNLAQETNLLPLHVYAFDWRIEIRRIIL